MTFVRSPSIKTIIKATKNDERDFFARVRTKFQSQEKGEKRKNEKSQKKGSVVGKKVLLKIFPSNDLTDWKRNWPH